MPRMRDSEIQELLDGETPDGAALAANLKVELADALHLPYADASFDIALCTLALHHFAPDDAVGLVRGLVRVGRQALIVDISRSTVAYAGSLLPTRALPMNAMTRHDAPVSVRRAYSLMKARAIARRAGLPADAVQAAFPFRLVVQSPLYWSSRRAI